MDELAQMVSMIVRDQGFYAGLSLATLGTKSEAAGRAKTKSSELALEAERDRREIAGLPSCYNRRAERALGAVGANDCWVDRHSFIPIPSVDGLGRQAFYTTVFG